MEKVVSLTRNINIYNNIPLFEELFAELYKLTKNKIYNSVTFKIYSKE